MTKFEVIDKRMLEKKYTFGYAPEDKQEILEAKYYCSNCKILSKLKLYSRPDDIITTQVRVQILYCTKCDAEVKILR